MKRIAKSMILTMVVGITLVVGLFVSERAFAEISSVPYVFSQKVTITNPDGVSVDCKDRNGAIISSFSISYGTILWTANYDGVTDEIVKIKNDSYGCDSDFSLSRSDIDFVDDFFNEEETLRTETSRTWFREPISKYIIDDEVYLYKGPHERYGKNDDGYHLPAEVIVTSRLHDGAWMYIEYEGHSGWIYYYNTYKANSHVANIAEDNDSITLSKETEVIFRTKPAKDGEIIASVEVPQLTKLTKLYYFSPEEYASWNYVAYDQYSGWYFIDRDDIVEADEDESAIAIKETVVMSKIDGGEELGKISRNAIAKVLYHYIAYGNHMYYVTYNDLSGWVSAKDLCLDYWSTDTQTFENARAIYDGVNGEKTGDMLPAGDYTVLYMYIDGQNVFWYYVAQNVVSKYSYDALGWVKADAEEAEAVIKELKEKYTQESEDISAYNNESDDSLKNALLWIIIGAFTLSITIVVSLAIWKKNRINEKDEPKNEVNDNGAKKEDEIESSSELKNNEGDQNGKNPTNSEGDNNDA